MPLGHRLYDTALVLAPTGRLDHDNCEAFREDLAPHLERSARDRLSLVLDLSGLEYVSSAGLRCFMLAAKQAKAQNSRIVIAAMQPVVAEIFQIARLSSTGQPRTLKRANILISCSKKSWNSLILSQMP